MEHKQLYQQALELGIGDLLEQIRNAESEDEKSFYAALLNWHFQCKQRKTIEQNAF